MNAHSLLTAHEGLAARPLLSVRDLASVLADAARTGLSSRSVHAVVDELAPAGLLPDVVLIAAAVARATLTGTQRQQLARYERVLAATATRPHPASR